MSKQNLSTVTYAAGAGLAAIALVYVFAPTYLIDETSPRKPHAVGLRNIGNDCFINSVLQALAGCGELRLYLIRETHRRAIDADVYTRLVQPSPDDASRRGGAPLRDWQIRSLQTGAVSRGLKEILDKLNERPISKKAISPREFVGVLERAFGQTINRQQQDAQEFLQLLVERLLDEYNAGKRARAHARRLQRSAPDVSGTAGTETSTAQENLGGSATATDENKGEEGEEHEEDEEEHDFPLEGEREAQSQCQTCGFRTTPRKEVFCMLTLSVPQASATTLDRCFDGLFKTEQIPDYRCDRCRLIHARDLLAAEHAKSPSDETRARLDRLQACIDTDPENPPQDVPLPDPKLAPTSTISRSHRITRFPKILVIHLSRSIYDRTSQKNMAKVSFPENLRLGGLRLQKRYRLLSTVTHKGGHQSGHYQSFRRQVATPAPFSNPHVSSGVYGGRGGGGGGAGGKGSSPSETETDMQSSEESSLARGNREKDRSDTSSIRSAAASAISKLSPSKSGERESPPSKVALGGKAPKTKRSRQMWWRINDEKCKAARTSEVLDMEREVYLLFYELQPDEGADSPSG
ncbi:hypothetical protein VUR80DRAFT_9303 [Thermomyces stellatus]